MKTTRLAGSLLLAGLILPGFALAQPAPPLTPDEAFGDITRILTNATSEEVLQIKADGSVRLERRGLRIGMVQPPPVIGTADPVHIADLAAVIARADFPNMPRDLTPTAALVGGTKFFFRVLTKNTPSLDRKVKGYQGFEGQFKAKLDAVNEVMNKIRANINTQPAGSGFSALTRKIFRPAPVMRPLLADPSTSVLWGTSETFEIDKDGKARFTWSAPNVRTRPIDGQATPAELRELNAAIDQARLSTIPSHLPQPVHIVAATTFELSVDASASSNQATIDGELGYYEQWDGQLRPVMKALDRIVERLRAAQQPTRDEAKGDVEVRGYYGFRTVWLVESSSMEYEVKPWSFARTLIKFEGRQVKVKGAVKDTDPGKGEITATDMISPVREDLSGNVMVVGGEALIDSSGPIFIPSPVIGPGRRPGFPPRPSHAIKTFGAAAAVLTQAPDVWATVDAWVFKDGYGAPYEAFVVAVRANAKKNADLTRWGQVVNKVRDGEEILLTRLSRSGNYVLAQPNSGRDGYLRVSDVSMGGMRLYTSTPPVAQPLATLRDNAGQAVSPVQSRGLTGALGR